MPALKTLKTRVLSAVTPQLGALKGTPMVYMEDSVNPWGLETGLPAYAGYYNGTYANLTGIRSRFPTAYIVSVTPNGANGAMCIDIEPGDAVPSDAPAFFRNSNHGGAIKPWFYASASNTQAVINALSNAGIARSEYFIWSAHFTGEHMCGPQTCGWPQADATQFKNTSGYDRSLVAAYCFSAQPVPPNPFPILHQGDTGAPVKTLQEDLNKWGAVPTLTVDGVFGAGTETAVVKFQTTHKLSPDGVVGPNTWAILRTTPVPPTPPKPPVPPAAPANFTHSDIVSVTLSWAAVTGAGEYAITLTDTTTNTAVSYTSKTTSLAVPVRAGRPYKATVSVNVPNAGVATQVFTI